MKKKFICLSALLIITCMMMTSCITDMFGKAGITQPPESTEHQTTPTTEASQPGGKPGYDDIDLDDYIKVDYKDLTLFADELPPEITDKLVEKNLNGLADYYTTQAGLECEFTTVTEGIVEEWDLVEISFVGKMNGEVFEGGSSVENVWIIVNDEESGYIPGFAEGLIGAEIGKMKEVNVTFPDNYAEELAGKEAVFEITVYSQKIYNISDEYIEKLTDGDYKTVADFKEYYKDYLASLYESELLSSLSEQIIEVLGNNTTVYAYPDEQLLYYYNSNVSYMTLQAESLGMSYEDYMAATGETEDTLRAIAEESVREDMMVKYILDKENKALTDEEYIQAIDYYVNYYNSYGYTYDREAIISLFEYNYYPGYLRDQLNRERMIQIVFGLSNIALKPAEPDVTDHETVTTAVDEPQTSAQ